MKCGTANEIRLADQAALASGITGEHLMGRACKALADELAFFADHKPRPVVIVTGPGNNGGDGWGLAWHLHQLGWPVWVWSAASREQVQGDAASYLARVETSGVRTVWKDEASHWESAFLDVPSGAWLIDSLLGTGSTEAPRGTVAAAVGFFQEAATRHRVWAVDLPTGLDADQGVPFDESACVRADATLTLGAAKIGFQTPGASRWTGPVSVLDLGLTMGEDEEEKAWDVLTNREVRESLPGHDPEDHKGTRGHALFIGGSPGMSGSISLAAVAALRSGCGLSSVFAPFTTAPSIDIAHREVIVIPGKQGKFMTLSPQAIKFKPYRAVCMGPGLRVNPDSIEAVRRVLQDCRHPLVLDADALCCLAQIGLRVGGSRRPVYLTPHPGEMGRLLDRPTAEVQQDRKQSVLEAAGYSHAHVVLKGTSSLCASASGKRWVNLSGNSALATAGSGDVLAGIVTGLLARGMDKELVMPVAVNLHGRAGELASIRHGVTSVVAGDVLDALPQVFQQAEGR